MRAGFSSGEFAKLTGKLSKSFNTIDLNSNLVELSCHQNLLDRALIFVLCQIKRALGKIKELMLEITNPKLLSSM